MCSNCQGGWEQDYEIPEEAEGEVDYGELESLETEDDQGV
jgi:hypothetical protein